MKRKVQLFLILFILVFALLPGYNFWQHAKTYDYKKLFNTDTLESYFNFCTYKVFNKSTLPGQVIIGKNGFTFMSMQVRDRLHNYKEYHNKNSLKNFTNNLLNTQKENNKKNIKFIYVVGPNKTTVYKDMLPKWYNTPTNKNSTDQIFEELDLKSVNLLDLRKTLISHRAQNKFLYYKNDHHWNELGALIGFESTLDFLNQLYNLSLKKSDYHIEEVKLSKQDY